ncbi:hypothetical protein GcC1_053017 [Golovinomyces cichoracearum]|uniref:Uncharacterized protein n=1 Tax=Golovinomyces cichoracearum TaxID=62708 RepID=A0A420IVT5_9PEZI|nr:hypothetical protein GcC1_053017 [Golovinomyces cichoracearum]
MIDYDKILLDLHCKNVGFLSKSVLCRQLSNSNDNNIRDIAIFLIAYIKDPLLLIYLLSILARPSQSKRTVFTIGPGSRLLTSMSLT